MATIDKSIIVWKRHVNLQSQSFQSLKSDLWHYYISTDEDPRKRIESFAMINLRGVSTKLYYVRDLRVTSSSCNS